MAVAEVGRSVEDIPFVPPVTRHVFTIVDLRTVSNIRTALPTSCLLFLGGDKLAAVDGSDREVFPKHDFWAQLKQIEIFVRNEPLVAISGTNCKHQSDSTLAHSPSVEWRNQL